ncbi:MAG TPA: polysaccharide deacetylase family protein [Syntrophales bacterium]|nr:polysaccharide deacetylase family protein [Syntrophales bacterium]HOM07156.1 polysaccharide deacetylase family protein [Syntrophales bacterium]HOO00415.1 polysaccharide deacetylase family protein [Syntrophales bacterium]HPQ06765.1 polysaccharide deacetylase family protein [Syntrophales bacterium]HRS87265.1 polysaccharide deacetylase family protein [Syntrophales bacterium]
MMAETLIGLKIDVDTYLGMKRGVPRLLEILGEAGLRGSFFLSMGPDASGLAVFHLLRNPRFLRKMIGTNAPALYGWRTALYGTLLPSPLIAVSFPDLVRRIMAEGHEVQLHAWDHRRWQDSLPRRSRQWIRDWFDRGIGAFRQVTGREPTAFGAPAWRLEAEVMEVLKELDFTYLSCTRAEGPFIHEGLGIPEIPSDLPCLEETGLSGAAEALDAALARGGCHVLPVHAEMEGGVGAGVFVSLLERWRRRGCRFATLDEIRRGLALEGLPVRSYRTALLPGRAFPCAV